MKNTLSFFLVLSLSLLGACATPKPASSMAAAAPAKAYYLDDATLAALPMSPPPAVDSDDDRQDLAAVKDWQAKRSPAQCRRAGSEAKPRFDTFFGSLRPFGKSVPPDTAEFLDRVRSDTFRAVGLLKDKYNRPRPFARDGALHPCIPMPGKNDTHSYPSGHATLGRVYALILSNLRPQQRNELMARGDEIALDRVIGGVHHPADVQAGRRLADEIYADLLKSPAFLADLETARRHLQ